MNWPDIYELPKNSTEQGAKNSTNTELKDVIDEKNVSLEQVINAMNELSWKDIWWWHAEVTDDDDNKHKCILIPDYNKINRFIDLLKKFFSSEDWLQQFKEYIEKNDPQACVNTLWNIDIEWLIQKHTSYEKLWITKEQYEELINLLKKNSSGR